MKLSAGMYDDTAPSPASSLSQMSTGSDPSPSPSPSLTSSSSSCPYTPDTPYRYTYYDEYSVNLNGGAPPPVSLRPLPTPTHQSEYDEALQQKFSRSVEARDRLGLEELLRCHSHRLNVNQHDKDGMTPLQRFCGSGDLDLVQMMVRYGADTQLRSREGWSPLHYATYSGSQETLLYVIRMCSSRR